MSWTKLIGLMYSRYLQYSVACMGPPPCPCPACAPCTGRQGQAHHGGCRAGRLVALSFGTSLGAQFNFSRDTSAVPLSLLHRPRGASKAKRTERKLQHHQFFNLVCRLAAISRDPARIPWFAPASNPSQRVRPAVAQQPSNPLYCIPEAPSAPGTTGTWLLASTSVAACLRLPHAHRCELRQSFASAESPLATARRGHAPACTSATRLTVCCTNRYETTPPTPPLLYLKRRPTVSQYV